MARRRKGTPSPRRARREETRRTRAGRSATAARPRRRRSSPLPWVLGGLAALLLVGGLAFFAFRQATREVPGVAVADLGNQHIANIGDPHAPYNSAPPTSGPHIGSLAPGGIHQSQIPDELQIHNLEDGFVLVQYDCPQGCPELVRGLEGVVRQALADNRDLILAPYNGIKTPQGTPARIALTAWARIETFDEFDRERILRFIGAFEGIDHHVRRGP